jgi:hypothetical protein
MFEKNKHGSCSKELDVVVMVKCHHCYRFDAVAVVCFAN